jgi:hypothetical protein
LNYNTKTYVLLISQLKLKFFASWGRGGGGGATQLTELTELLLSLTFWEEDFLQIHAREYTLYI